MFGCLKSSQYATNEAFPVSDFRTFSAARARAIYLRDARLDPWCTGEDLSGRQCKNFVPCRNRPPLKWSWATSATTRGDTGSHSPVRSVLQRLGPPGALPVKPGCFLSASNLFVNSRRCDLVKADVNPT